MHRSGCPAPNGDRISALGHFGFYEIDDESTAAKFNFLYLGSEKGGTNGDEA